MKSILPSFDLLKGSPRNQVALIMSFAAMFLLIPGLSLSMLHISTTGAVDAPLTRFDINFFDTNNSILTTVNDLFDQGYYIVSTLIFLFSVVVPTAKIIMLVQALFMKQSTARRNIIRFIQSIGKWSMCDVFVVAIFLSYLSTGTRNTGETHESSILGVPIEIDILVNMDAHLETGFYCFLGYCLTSLIALQFFEEKPGKVKLSN